MRPTCSTFLCTNYAFAFELPDGSKVMLCEECAAQRGLSSGGKSFQHEETRTIDQVMADEVRVFERAVKGELPTSKPDLPTPAPTISQGAVMKGTHVKRLDNGQVFGTLEAAAASVDGTGSGLHLAIKGDRQFKGVTFVFTDEPVNVSPDPEAIHVGAPPLSAPPAPSAPAPVRSSPPPASAPRAIVKAKAQEVPEVRRVDTVPSVTSVFAALSSMAAGMRGLELTDIEVSTAEVTVKVKTLKVVVQ